MRDDGALAVSILLSAHFRVGGRKHRMRDHLGVASQVTGEGTIASIDGLAAELLGFISMARLRDGGQRRGSTFWFRLKKFVGSYWSTSCLIDQVALETIQPHAA